MSKRALNNYIPVDKEDLDEIPVNVGDIPSFVRIYFGDNSDGKYIPSEKETDSHGLSAYRKYDVDSAREIIYVENAVTGEFVPIKVIDKKNEAFQDDANTDTAENENADDEQAELVINDDDDAIDQEHVGYMLFLRIFFLFMQGILSGFAFATLFLQVEGNSDEDLLMNYRVYAVEYRRLFYFLTTFAVVGSGDMLLTLPKMIA